MAKFADLHVHTKYSAAKNCKPHVKFPSNFFVDSTLEIEDIFREAKNKGLSAISITDHNNQLAYKHIGDLERQYGITLIPGVEVDTIDGDILAYGVSQNIPDMLSAKETIDYIHKIGGVAVAAHPFPVQRSDIAAWVGSYGGEKENAQALSLGQVEELNFDGIEAYDIFTGSSEEAEALADRLKIAKISSSDSHSQYSIGTSKTAFPDDCITAADYINAIKNAKTMVGKSNKVNLIRTAIDVLINHTIKRPK